MGLNRLRQLNLLENLVLRIDATDASVMIVVVGVGAAVESALAGARNVRNLHRTFTRVSFTNVRRFEARPGMLKLGPPLSTQGFCAAPGAPVPVVQGVQIHEKSAYTIFDLRMGTFGAVSIEFQEYTVDELHARAVESNDGLLYVDVATGARFKFYEAFANNSRPVPG